MEAEKTPNSQNSSNHEGLSHRACGWVLAKCACGPGLGSQHSINQAGDVCQWSEVEAGESRGHEALFFI